MHMGNVYVEPLAKIANEQQMYVCFAFNVYFQPKMVNSQQRVSKYVEEDDSAVRLKRFFVELWIKFYATIMLFLFNFEWGEKDVKLLHKTTT